MNRLPVLFEVNCSDANRVALVPEHLIRLLLVVADGRHKKEGTHRVPLKIPFLATLNPADRPLFSQWERGWG